jgi:hypothetical protein
MTTAIESYGTLHYSPFILAPLFEAFYERAIVQPRNVLLCYLVLPLVLHPQCRRFFRNAVLSSSLTTFAHETSRLYGLPERVQESRELTHACMQLAVDAGGIRISDDLSVAFRHRVLDPSACPQDAERAARNLAKVLRRYDVPAVYRQLGMRKL